MSGDVGAEVAAVLAAHDWLTPRGYAWPCCTCGEEFPGGEDAAYAHVADALAPLIAERVEAAKAEALREAADDFRTHAARVWGGQASWLTTGERVANLAAEWLTESADDLRPEACAGDHAGPCFDGRPDLCADILRDDPEATP